MIQLLKGCLSSTTIGKELEGLPLESAKDVDIAFRKIYEHVADITERASSRDKK
jgi:hypothetical protein